MLHSSTLSTPQNTSPLLIAFLVHFLLALDALVIVPFSAVITTQLAVSGALAGYLTMAYALAAGVTCLLFKGADNINTERRRCLTLLLGLALVTGASVWVASFEWMIIARVVAGVCGGGLAVVNLNLMVLQADDEHRRKHTALLLSAFPLALTLGVPLLLLLAGDHWQWSFAILALSLLAVWLVFFLICRRVAPGSEPDSGGQNPRFSEVVAERRVLWFAVAMISSAVLGTFVVSTQFPVMLHLNLTIGAGLLSGCYTFGGLGSFIVMQTYARLRLTSGQSGQWIFILTAVMLGAMVCGFNTQDVWLAAGAFVFFIIASSARSLILATEMIATLPIAVRNHIIGIQNALQHFAVGVGGALGSVLIATDRHGQLDFSVMLWAAAALGVVPVLLWRYRRWES